MRKRYSHYASQALHCGRMELDRGAVAAIGTTLILWASAFVAIRVALPGLGVAALSLGRLLVAAAALAVVAVFSHVRRPQRRDLARITGCGLAGMTVYQLLLNTGERTVPAGTASLLVATAPIFAALLAVALLGEALGTRTSAGHRCRVRRGRHHGVRPGRRRSAERRRAAAAGRRGVPGVLLRPAETAACPLHQPRGDVLRDVGRHPVLAAAGALAGRRSRPRARRLAGRAGVPRARAKRHRLRHLGVRTGPSAGRGADQHPLPGPADRHRRGLVGPRRDRAPARPCSAAPSRWPASCSAGPVPQGRPGEKSPQSGTFRTNLAG